MLRFQFTRGTSLMCSQCSHEIPDFPKQTSNISPEHLNAAVAAFRSPPPTPTPCSSSVGGKKGDLTWCWLGGRWSSGNSWMGHHCAHCLAAPASKYPSLDTVKLKHTQFAPSQFVALVMRRYTHIINKVHFAMPPHSE